jgi:hypothetical protein
MLLEIEGQSNILKDSDSGGVVTKHSAEFEEYKKRVNNQNRINNVIKDVDYLKTDILEIKQLLREIKNGD